MFANRVIQGPTIRGIETMKVARMSARGRTTIPRSIREAAGIYVGDTLAFEVRGQQVVIRKASRDRDGATRDALEIMSEWTSSEDEEAWRDL